MYRFPKNGNSGIGIRTVPFTGPLETRPSQAAYEIQLLSDAGAVPSRADTAKKPLAGSVSLQNHGSLVELRNVRLTDLSRPGR